MASDKLPSRPKKRKGETELSYQIRLTMWNITHYVSEKQKEGFNISQPNVTISHSWKSLERARQQYSAKELRKQLEFTDTREGVKLKGYQALRRKRKDTYLRGRFNNQIINTHIDDVMAHWENRPNTFDGFRQAYISGLRQLADKHGIHKFTVILETIADMFTIEHPVAYDDSQRSMREYFDAIDNYLDSFMGTDEQYVERYETLVGEETDVAESDYYGDYE